MSLGRGGRGGHGPPPGPPGPAPGVVPPVVGPVQPPPRPAPPHAAGAPAAQPQGPPFKRGGGVIRGGPSGPPKRGRFVDYLNGIPTNRVIRYCAMKCMLL